jgi:hypothetical protein
MINSLVQVVLFIDTDAFHRIPRRLRGLFIEQFVLSEPYMNQVFLNTQVQTWAFIDRPSDGPFLSVYSCRGLINMTYPPSDQLIMLR